MTRKCKLEDVPLEKMRVREGISQRSLRQNWVATLASTFDPDRFQPPTVNHSGEWFWVLDGQHRVAALKNWLGKWEGQKVECWVYKGLSEQEEAQVFDLLNNTKNVSLYDKYRVRITAGEPDETNVDAIVRLNGLKVSSAKERDAVACVGTLMKVYRRSPDCLNRTLGISKSSFGDAGLEADIIDGIGALLGRYDGQVEDPRMVKALNGIQGGVTALRQRGERLRHQFGGPRAHAIAAAAVEAYNRGRGGKKLPAWWKSEG